MKNKFTKITVSLIAVIIMAFGTSAGISASAAAGLNEFDTLFRSTLSDILDYENAESAFVSCEKELVYDINLAPLGIVYSFTTGGNNGFAIIIDNGSPQVTEVSLENSSPFSDGLYVYVTFGMYWTYDGMDFYDCETGLLISDEAINTVNPFAYFGALTFYYATEQLNFEYRSESRYNILSSIPSYFYGLANGCAAVAGTNLIAYYDKSFTNLIPNYDPGTSFLGMYMYKSANATTNALTETLHADMGTNSSGTTASQFKNGMKKYINRQGYNVSYSSLKSGSSINFESAKTAVQSNKAIALFLAGFKTTVITNAEGYDTLSYEYSYENHMAAGFGCLEVAYIISSAETRTDKYLYCSMGVGMYRNGYINLSTTTIDEALILNIS